jgi:hypothetical protein
MSIRIGSNGPDVACADCGKRLLPDGRQPAREWYMVTDVTWDASGMEPLGGCLCIACLEARLHRRITWRDLDPAAGPINEPNQADTPRLYALKLAAAKWRAGP